MCTVTVQKSVPLGGSIEHDSQDNEKTQYSHFINNFTTQLRLQSTTQCYGTNAL